MIFITGATGFLGAHLLYHLLKENNEVLVLKRPESRIDYIRKIFTTYGKEVDKLFDKIQWMEGDVTDYASLIQIEQPIEKIYHLAAMVSFDPRDREKLLETNVLGTSNMIDFALERNISEFIHMSSVAALDPVKADQYVTEKQFGNNPERKSVYAESKFKSELEVWRGIEEGLKALILNPSVVIGPGMSGNSSGKIFSSIKNGLSFYPGGITGFVDVRDVCKIILELTEKEAYNERFIINEGNYSYRKLFAIIAHEYGIKEPTKRLKPYLSQLLYKLDWTKSALTGKKRILTKELHQSMHNKTLFSNDKLQKTLNHPFIPIEQTVQDTLKHLL